MVFMTKFKLYFKQMFTLQSWFKILYTRSKPIYISELKLHIIQYALYLERTKIYTYQIDFTETFKEYRILDILKSFFQLYNVQKFLIIKSESFENILIQHFVCHNILKMISVEMFHCNFLKASFCKKPFTNIYTSVGFSSYSTLYEVSNCDIRRTILTT